MQLWQHAHKNKHGQFDGPSARNKFMCHFGLRNGARAYVVCQRDN